MTRFRSFVFLFDVRPGHRSDRFWKPNHSAKQQLGSANFESCWNVCPTANRAIDVIHEKCRFFLFCINAIPYNSKVNPSSPSGLRGCHGLKKEMPPFQQRSCIPGSAYAKGVATCQNCACNRSAMGGKMKLPWREAAGAAEATRS